MKEKRGKEKLNRARVILIFLSLFSILFIDFQISRGNYRHYYVFLWLLAQVFLLLSVSFYRPKIKELRIPVRLLVFFLLLFPLIIRAMNFDPLRIHADEFISAHISQSLNLKTLNFFASTPDSWVCQFPLPYFILQKIFFSFFKITPNLVRFSILPYVFLVSLFLYLLVKNLLGKKTAYFTLILFSFFAPSLYLETWGLHFISSTAFFLAFFYFLIKTFQAREYLFPTLTGMALAFCFMNYPSSYLALPLLIIFSLIQAFYQKKFSVLKKMGWSFLVFIIISSPFFIYAFKFNNYFFQRYNQVNLLTGSWSPVKNTKEPIMAIGQNLTLSFQSLYKSNVGGSGGYDFGHLALLETSGIFLSVFGLLVLFFTPKNKNKFYLFLVLASIAIFFFTGMVLTLPPPNYQRFSISFPFLIIIMSLPFYRLLEEQKIKPVTKYFLAFFLLFIFSCQNYSYFKKAIELDYKNKREDLEDIKVINFIEKNYPNRQLYIAAFPTFALAKVYFFYHPDRKIITLNHQEALEAFNSQEKYIYIILFPEEFSHQFQKLDPRGKIINSVSWKYDLFAN